MGLLFELLGFAVASVFVVGLLAVPAFPYWVLERGTQFDAAAERRKARGLVGVGVLLAFLGLEITIASFLWDLDGMLSLGVGGSLSVGMGAILVAIVPIFLGYWLLEQAQE